MTEAGSDITDMKTRQQIDAMHKIAEMQKLAPSGGDPHNPEMEARVSKLETHMEYVRRDLDEIKAGNKSISEKLDAVANSVQAARAETATTIFDISRRFTDAQNIIITQLAALPTRDKLFGYTATVAALAIAIVSVFVGVLAYVGALPHR